MNHFFLNFKIFIKTLGIFSATLAFVGFSAYLGYDIYYSQRKSKAIEQIAEKPQNLPLITNPVKYNYTDQTWFVPPHQVMLTPMRWLSDYENCIFSTRMNAMKHAGLVPKNYTVQEFARLFSSRDLYGKFGLSDWKTTLNETILSEINHKINPGSKTRYKWISLSSMDELIYLAKRNQHVMVGITMWMKPKKGQPPKRWRDSPISHAITITGIKAYDAATDTIEFETADPLPFTFINNIPAYSKFKPDGYGKLGRQAVPYLVKHGTAKSGYVIAIHKDSNDTPNKTLSYKEKPSLKRGNN